MKIVGVAACTVGIAHTYMAQKAIQDECAARGIECKVEAQGGLGIENELTQEDVDSADLVLESVDVGVENEDRFERFLFYPHRRYRRRVSRLLAGIRYRRRQRHGGYESADGES